MSQTKPTKKLPLYVCTQPDNSVCFENSYGSALFIPGMLYRADPESLNDLGYPTFDQPGWSDFYDPDEATMVEATSIDVVDQAIDKWAEQAKARAREIFAKRGEST